VNLAGLRDFAHELADLADAVSVPAFRSGLEVRTKADGSLVTDADTRIESILRDTIHTRLPGHGVLGEEAGVDGDGSGPIWIIDPIDGTTNFVKGNPVFATLIAFRDEGEDLVGVVSAPALGSRWDGMSGGPARQDGRAITVSHVDDLARAEVSFGALSILADAAGPGLVADLTRSTERQRGFGDFWMHCLVAAGSTDIAIEADVKVWDLAAVRVVVEAAGGRFSDLTGAPTSEGGSALSTNGRLHDAVLRLLDAAVTDADRS
jgi:histidinol-phosphatase